MKVRWARPALADLDVQLTFQRKVDPTWARLTAARIERSVSHLVAHPEMGRPGRIAGTRELVVPATPYVVTYRVIDDRVEILALLHASRKPR